MGLAFESPFNFDGSSAHDKATRLDSSHPSRHSPFEAFKAIRAGRRQSRQKSNKRTPTVPSSSLVANTTLSSSLPTQQSNLFKLPLSLRTRIYSIVVNPTGSQVLHVLVKHHPDPNKQSIRFRVCRADSTHDVSCSIARCKAWLDTATRAYRGSFDTIINLLLVSKDIEHEVSDFVYSHYKFDFDHPHAVRRFCRTVSQQAAARLKTANFEPQHWFFTHNVRGMMLPEDEWEATWQAFGSLQGLEKITVYYGPTSRKLPANVEVLDPRRYIPSRANLVIDVQAPGVEALEKPPRAPSYWFLLPQSIREQIYDYVISAYTKHVLHISRRRILHNHAVCSSLGFTSRSSYCCPDLPSFRSPGYRINAQAREIYFPVLHNNRQFSRLFRISRDIYHEASAKVYAKHEFVFDHPLAFVGFIGNLSPRCRDLITRVKLVFEDVIMMVMSATKEGQDPKAKFGIDFEVWEECWRVLDRMEGLKQLKVVFETRWENPEEGGKADPRVYLKRTERLEKFIVEAPWSKRAGDASKSSTPVLAAHQNSATG